MDAVRAGPADAELSEGLLNALLGYRLARAAVSTSTVFEQQVGQPHGLRPLEFSLLVLAQANAGAGPAALARALAISRPQTTQCLDRLEAAGLLKREPSPHDGRSLVVQLTDAGQQLASETGQRLQQAERHALRGLSGAEQAMLLELLGKVARLGTAA